MTDFSDDPIMSCDPEYSQRMENEMKEISSKLKKVVCVDESENQYHSISPNVPNTPTSFTNIMAIRVDTGNNTLMRNNLPARNIGLISDHLRKYSNSLIKIKGNHSMPNLRVKFVSKFTGCYFPIGVSYFVKFKLYYC